MITYVNLPKGKKGAASVSEANIVVEPQATKIDILGYVQPGSTKTFDFEIGNLDGSKAHIQVNFKD